MNGYSRVILILIEACGSDPLARACTPNIDILARAGASTMSARSAGPSLFGVLTSQGSDSAGPSRCGMRRSVIDLAHRNGRAVGIFSSQPNASRLLGHDPLGSLRSTTWSAIGEYLSKTVTSAVACIRSARPDLTVIHLARTETGGEETATEHIERSDRGVGTILNGLSLFGLFDRYHILVHGLTQRDDEPLPWMACGPGIRSGLTIARDVSTLDTAPAIASLMGLPHLDGWEGSSPEEIFREASSHLKIVA